MADILPFARPVAPDQGVVSTTPSTFDRAAFRNRVAVTAQAFLDIAHHCLGVLDRLDKDPDFEPDVADEDDGTAEPAMAAFVALTGLRWCGFDGGAA